jgi:hypothetical protein
MINLNATVIRTTNQSQFVLRYVAAGDRNILIVLAVGSSPAVMSTVTNERLDSSASQVTQPDATSTGPELAENRRPNPSEAETEAGNLRINVVEAVVADCSPDAAVEHLETTLEFIRTADQTRH